MYRLRPLRFLATGVILAFLAVGCSHGSRSPVSPDVPGDRSTAAATIALGAVVETGNEISVPVDYSDADDLYAMSFRVGFDPAGLVPVAVEWGRVVEEEDAIFHKLDCSGFVPLAFTRFSGLRGIGGDGTLCTLRFRVLDQERANCRLVADEDYLVAFSSLGERRTLRIGGEAR